MNPANLITVCRILLVPVFIGLLLYWTGQHNLRIGALTVFAAAYLTDALDGAIARKFNLRTELGTLLDPIADKLLLVSAYIGLAFFPNIPDEYRVPSWLTLVVLSRDIILVAGTVLVYMILGKLEAHPNLLGKLTTLFQMIFIATLLLGAGPLWRTTLAAVAGALTVLSGLWYLRGGLRSLSRPVS